MSGLRYLIFTLVLACTVGCPGAWAGLGWGSPAAKTNQSITFPPVADQRFGGSPLILSATASSGLPVSFEVVSGPATISGNTVAFTGAGVVIIQASQAGNTNYNAAPSVLQSFNVNKANQTISLAPIGAQTMAASPLVLHPSASSGLPVELYVLSGPARVAGDTVWLTGAGFVNIQAYQAGDTNYNAAPYVLRSFFVTKSNQTITFNDLSERVQAGPDFTLSATASSGLPVTFTLLYGPAMLTGNVVRLLGIGQVYVQATQAGNAVYNSVSIDSSFCIIPIKPYITADGLVLTSSSPIQNQWFLNGEAIPGADTRAITVSESGNYTVRVSSPDSACGPSATSDVYTLQITGTETSPDQNWRIYPNPARSILHLQVPPLQPNATIRISIYNHTGAEVLSQTYHRLTTARVLTLDVGQLSPGVYLLKVVGGYQFYQQKLLIE